MRLILKETNKTRYLIAGTREKLFHDLYYFVNELKKQKGEDFKIYIFGGIGDYFIDSFNRELLNRVANVSNILETRRRAESMWGTPDENITHFIFIGYPPGACWGTYAVLFTDFLNNSSVEKCDYNYLLCNTQDIITSHYS